MTACCSSTYLLADNGHIDCIKPLIDKGQMFHDVYYFTAKTGDMEFFKALHRHGCKADDTAISEAVRYNRLEMLHYAIENDFPISDQAYYYAKSYEYPSIVNYFMDGRCRYHEDFVSFFEKES